jgi:hypothetical protein
MASAMGDLILTRRGDLATRVFYDLTTLKDLPFDQHTPGTVLAIIGLTGWTLTPEGAQFILEKCPPNNPLKVRNLVAIASRNKSA